METIDGLGERADGGLKLGTATSFDIYIPAFKWGIASLKKASHSITYKRPNHQVQVKFKYYNVEIDYVIHVRGFRRVVRTP